MTGNLNRQALIVVRSVTQAMQGQQVLQRHGITSILERDTSAHLHNGCGYGLRITEGKTLRAAEILRQSGIEILRVVEG